MLPRSCDDEAFRRVTPHLYQSRILHFYSFTYDFNVTRWAVQKLEFGPKIRSRFTTISIRTQTTFSSLFVQKSSRVPTHVLRNPYLHGIHQYNQTNHFPTGSSPLTGSGTKMNSRRRVPQPLTQWPIRDLFSLFQLHNTYLITSSARLKDTCQQHNARWLER